MKIRMLSIEELEAQGYKVAEHRPGWYDITDCTDWEFYETWFDREFEVLFETTGFVVDTGTPSYIPKEFCEVLD